MDYNDEELRELLSDLAPNLFFIIFVIILGILTSGLIHP